MNQENRLRADRKRRVQRGSVMVMFTLLLPVTLMLAGLAIDRTMVFIVESKLSAAVDGAALGAGRLLGTNANTTEIAGEFLAANYPAGFWRSYDLTPNISYTTQLALHTITVSATVKVPLLFLRILNQQYATIGATATANRKDSRVVMVLDRSGSMQNSGSMPCLITGALSLTNAFSAPSDELGLVVYGSTGLVAYPSLPRPYSAAIPCANSAQCGPDCNFGDGSATDMLHMINAIESGGATNMSEGLALAYTEVQKAYNRDVAINGSDNKLNAIVLFTDGMPTAFSTYLNSPNNPPGNVITGGSNNCTNQTATGVATTQMMGGIGTFGNGSTSDQTFGLFRLATAYNENQSTLTWLGINNDYALRINPTTPTNNCNNLNDAEDGTDLNDLTKLPAYDLYGTSTTNHNATDYQYSWLYNHYHTAFTPTNSTAARNGYQLGIAAWNLTDNMGYRIRTQTAVGPIYLLTIGLCVSCSNPPSSSDSFDAGLLKRLANTPDSTSYSAAQPPGEYVYATNCADLVSAFKFIAGTILRLAH